VNAQALLWKFPAVDVSALRSKPGSGTWNADVLSGALLPPFKFANVSRLNIAKNLSEPNCKHTLYGSSRISSVPIRLCDVVAGLVRANARRTSVKIESGSVHCNEIMGDESELLAEY
jgi:hypothetical protein